MFDRPWVRLVLGALAAALLGAMAARVAVSAGDGAAGGGAASAARSSGGGGSRSGASDGGGGAASSSGSSGAGGATASLGSGSGRVTVHVTGEVRRPGVYGLAEGARVDDAVRRAGGATRDGDRQGLNLAAPVRDGQQVRVPAKARAAVGGAAPAAGAAADGTAPGTPVDLNTASLEELQTLDGVGPTTAEKIVKLREERGGLAGVDDLDEVPGIGAKKLEALRAQLEP